MAASLRARLPIQICPARTNTTSSFTGDGTALLPGPNERISPESSCTEAISIAVGPDAAHRFLAEAGGDVPDATWIQNYMFTRARTIAGGTSEVQRNVVANELLGA